MRTTTTTTTKTTMKRTITTTTTRTTMKRDTTRSTIKKNTDTKRTQDTPYHPLRISEMMIIMIMQRTVRTIIYTMLILPLTIMKRTTTTTTTKTTMKRTTTTTPTKTTMKRDPSRSTIKKNTDTKRTQDTTYHPRRVSEMMTIMMMQQTVRTIIYTMLALTLTIMKR